MSPSRVEFAGHHLCVDIDPSAASILPALRDRVVDVGEGPTASFRAVAGRSPHERWDPSAPGPQRLPGGGLAVSCPSPASVAVFDGRAGLELWGTPAAFTDGDLVAHPAHAAIAAWLSTRGPQVWHAGAVAFGDRATLLVGAGGAGKSTTAVACALTGATLLGDDLVAIDRSTGDGGPADALVVHPLYSTCKLTPASDRRLDTGGLATLGVTAGGKRVVAADGQIRPGPAAVIRSIVILQPSADPTGAVGTARRIDPGAAIRSMGPTALIASLGAVRLAAWLELAADAVRRVPVFELGLSWDLDGLVRAIESTVDGDG